MSTPVWLCEDDVHEGDDQFLIGTVARDGICARCGGLGMLVYDPQVQEPRPPHWGAPDFFTTSTVLAVYRPVIWDVNLYYRDLGVSPYATRKQIREAYQLAEGWNSERLTYIVKQLIDDDIRRRYDAVPVGSVFFDRYFAELVKRRIAEHLAEAKRMGMEAEEFDLSDIDQMVNNRSFGVVDEGVTGGQDSDLSSPEHPRSWGYWRWQSGSVNPEQIALWQELLVRTLSERKEIIELAVGIHRSSDASVRVLEVGHLNVVFLHEREWPTSALAEEAAGRVVQSKNQQEAVFA